MTVGISGNLNMTSGSGSATSITGANVEIDMTGGNFTMTGASNGSSTINANAATHINASQTLAALNIADGVDVTFGDGLPFVGPPDKSAGFGGGVALVPEPGSMGLLLVGALGLLGRRRRK